MGNSTRKSRFSQIPATEDRKFDVALHALEAKDCDLEFLRGLLRMGMPLNVQDERGKSALHYTVLKNKPKVMKFLLNRRGIQIDLPDKDGHSALILALMHDVPDCATELLKKGADVNFADNRGYTPLHYAVLYSTKKLFYTVLINKPYLDAQNAEGETPLHVACERCSDPEKILMLLYFGADAVISCNQGMIPLSLVIENRLLPSYVKEILYYYTLDGMAVVNLRTVVKAMISDSPLFSIVLDKVCEVTYNNSDLQYLNEHLPNVEMKCFKLFLKKFDHVVKDLLIHCNTITTYLLVIECIRRMTPNFVDFLNVLLESHLAFETVQSCCPSIPVIASLARIFYKTKRSLDELTEIVCCMLTHGLYVSRSDLNAVYVYYGRCELFTILLHMDIDVVDPFDCDCCTICDHEVVNDSIMTHLYCDVNFTMEKFLAKPLWFLSLDLDVLLDYFALAQLTHFFRTEGFKGHPVQEKVENMPAVPHLIELARNAARQFIIKRYNIMNSRQFYTVIKWLPIADRHKRILCYEDKIYNV